MSFSLPVHERFVIETVIKLNHSIHAIARFLKLSPATITYYKSSRIKPYNAQQVHHLVQCNQNKHGHYSSLKLEMVTRNSCSCIWYYFQNYL